MVYGVLTMLKNIVDVVRKKKKRRNKEKFAVNIREEELVKHFVYDQVIKEELVVKEKKRKYRQR